MASTINAQSTGAGGLVYSGDSSGQLALQANGSTIATVSSTGLAVTGSITTGGVVGSPYAMKNRIINGQFPIDQYNAGASKNTASGGGNYYIDRWFFYYAQTSKIASLGQNLNSITPPAGYSSYYGFQTAASTYTPLAGDYFDFGQVFEYNTIADLQWGTANAKAITVSFWVRSSQTGTFGGSIYNYNQTYGYAFTYTVSAANTWQFVTINIAGPTGGSWQSGNSAAFTLQLFPTTGSTYAQSTVGSWVSANVHGATGTVNLFSVANSTFYITGVQFEVGSSATSFEWRPYGTELQLCQRYYYRLTAPAGGDVLMFTAMSAGSTTVNGGVYVPVPMRAVPAMSANTNSYGYVRNNGAYTTYATNTSPSVAGGATNFFPIFYNSVASGLTGATLSYSYLAAGNYLEFSAEI